MDLLLRGGPPSAAKDRCINQRGLPSSSCSCSHPMAMN
jgi:hypothetical protein